MVISKKNLVKFLVVFSYLAMILVNTLATTLPINNVTPGEVSDSYPNLFAPAGFTFSIWGLIYILLGAFVIYFIFVSSKKSDEKFFEKLGFYFILTSVANFLWIFAWHYNLIFFSLVLMIFLLVCLIKIMEILVKRKLSVKESFFVRLPFSIYFGWISVATIANVTVFLVSVNWNGFGISKVAWTILILLIGAIIGIITTCKNKDIAYGLVFVWAYFGIWAKHTSELGFNSQYPSIINTVLVCMIFLLISVLYVSYLKFVKKC